MPAKAVRPMPDPIRFDCCYCHYELAVGEEQAECLIECAGCGRSVLVPRNNADGIWPAPAAPAQSRWLAAAFTSTAASLIGGLITALLTFAVAYVGSLRWIGFNFADAVLAGCAGLAIGMFVFGVLGWNIASR
jgi:hypothetical protein